MTSGDGLEHPPPPRYFALGQLFFLSTPLPPPSPLLRLGLIVDVSSHLIKAMLTAGFLARDFMGVLDLLWEAAWTKPRGRTSQTSCRGA